MIGRTFVVGLGVLASTLLVTAPAVAQDDAPAMMSARTRGVNVVLGEKMLDDKDWNKNFKAAGLPNLSSQTMLGVETTYGPKRWPVNLATDFLYSQASGKSTSLGRTVTGHTFELGLGVRKVFALSLPVAPYAGGGLAYGSGAVTCSGCTSKAPSGVGFWLGGGAVYQLSRLNAGVGLRYSSIDGKDGNVKLKDGGLIANVVVGYGF